MYLPYFISLLCSCLLCIQNVLGESVLQIPRYTFQTLIVGQNETIQCTASLESGSILIMQKNGSTAALIIATNLDQPTLSSLLANTSFSVSPVSASSPLYINATISYTIHSASNEHAGVYKCELGPAGKIATYNVSVHGPPTGVVISSPNSLGVGLKELASYEINEYRTSRAVYLVRVNIDREGDVTLKVEPVATPAATVHWSSKKAGEYEWQAETTDNSIIIERTREVLESTSYYIAVVNEYGSFNVTMEIVIEYPPRKPNISQTDFYPREGDAVASLCSFDAVPPVHVFFAKAKANTDEWSRMKNMDDEFLLPRVMLERDVGTYKCVGRNTHGEAIGVITIHGEPESTEVSIVNKYSTSVDISLSAKCGTNVIFEVIWSMTEENGVEKTVTKRWESDTAHDQLPYVVCDVTISSLTPSKSYTVHVKAINQYGSTEASNLLNFTTENDGVTRPRFGSILVAMEPTTTSDATRLTSGVLLWITGYIIMLL